MQLVPEWARTEVEEVVELACRVNVNAHGFGDDFKPNSVIGVGLFPLAAMVNHSCRPNCTFVYYGEQPEKFLVRCPITVHLVSWMTKSSQLCMY